MSDRYISLTVKSCIETGGRPQVSLLSLTQIFLVFKRSYLYLCISIYEMLLLLSFLCAYFTLWNAGNCKCKHYSICFTSRKDHVEKWDIIDMSELVFGRFFRGWELNSTDAELGPADNSNNNKDGVFWRWVETIHWYSYPVFQTRSLNCHEQINGWRDFFFGLNLKILSSYSFLLHLTIALVFPTKMPTFLIFFSSD
jgi:hypothetical protein